MINKGEVWVFDNFIDIEYQNKIKNTLMGDEGGDENPFPWYYIDDVTDAYSGNNQGRAALAHIYVNLWDDDTSSIESDHHDLFLPLLEKSCSLLQIPRANIIQGRSFLQFPLNLRSREDDTPHIDTPRNHVVVLYYVCDSDGKTIIYNENKESKRYSVKKKVSPKQGRVVIFDGGLYHTAQQPTKKIRCIANYNLG
jgi:hypothetical protein|tara:strand:+ start:894 stop:1481 length:588 start_codon:yes stop_codon:yes gene_type:complete